jgi:hypothetical protein
MNHEQTPTPRQQIVNALTELDTLKAMEQEPGFDKHSAHELEQEAISVIDGILADNTDLRHAADPVIARAFSIHGLSVKAHQKKLSERFPPKESPLKPLTYKVFENLSDSSLNGLHQLYLDLLDEEILKDSSVVVDNPEEAGRQLGLDASELEHAYGLLSAIDDKPAPDDIIEFVAITFESPEPEDGEPVPDGEGPSSKQGRYLGRVRKSAAEDIISIVLDAVPYVEDNAVYVLRNDDNTISSVEESFPSKKKARENGARRVFHRKETGEAGVLKRINKLLTMRFASFKRADQE